MNWSKPPARWGLKAGKRPQKHPALSGTVVVTGPLVTGFAYIRFEQPLADALGKKMPYGVSPLHPCHLRLFYVDNLGKWALFCHYIGSSLGVFLHNYPSKPEWLGKIYIVEESEDVEST